MQERNVSSQLPSTRLGWVLLAALQELTKRRPSQVQHCNPRRFMGDEPSQSL